MIIIDRDESKTWGFAVGVGDLSDGRVPAARKSAAGGRVHRESVCLRGAEDKMSPDMQSAALSPWDRVYKEISGLLLKSTFSIFT